MRRLSSSLFILVFFLQLPISAGFIHFKDAHAKRLAFSGGLLLAAAAIDIALQADCDAIDASDSGLDSRTTVEKWCERVAAVCTVKNWTGLAKNAGKAMCSPTRAWVFAKNHSLLSFIAVLSAVNVGISAYQLSTQPKSTPEFTPSAPAPAPTETQKPTEAAVEPAATPERSESSVVPQKEPLNLKIKQKLRISKRLHAELKKRVAHRKQQRELQKKLAEMPQAAGTFSSQSMGRKSSLSDGGIVIPDDMLDGIVRPWSANGREKHLKIPSRSELLRRSGSPWNLEIDPSSEDGYSSGSESDDEPVLFEHAPQLFATDGPSCVALKKPVAQKGKVVAVAPPVPLAAVKPTAVPFNPVFVRRPEKDERVGASGPLAEVRLNRGNVASAHVPSKDPKLPPRPKSRVRLSGENRVPISKAATFAGIWVNYAALCWSNIAFLNTKKLFFDDKKTWFLQGN